MSPGRAVRDEISTALARVPAARWLRCRRFAARSSRRPRRSVVRVLPFPAAAEQDGVVAAFVFAAENDQHPPGECIERLQRRIHIGGFRIVVVADPANLGDKFQAMLDAGESAHAMRDRRGPAPASRVAATAASTFSRL